MKQLKPLNDFFEAIKNDPHIGCSHIALFTALYNLWVGQGCQGPIVIFSYTVMPIAKIGGLGTLSQVIEGTSRIRLSEVRAVFQQKGK